MNVIVSGFDKIKALAAQQASQAFCVAYLTV
jgi:hypothetical protein